jgi:predicted nucleotidyltransferase
MISFDASTAVDLAPVARVLTNLVDHATACGTKIMVVGAVARDILIRHVVGSAPARATADIDIAVAVSSWSDVERLTAGMKPAGSVHKFLVRGFEVDVIPFGEIESTDRTITWSNDHRMDVFGFREAFSAAVDVALPGELVVAVASLPAQSLLKLFAWRDRRYDNKRDAIDLKAILGTYCEGPYFDELFDRYEPLLDRYGFDVRLTGAARMGHEARDLIAPTDRTPVTDLLFADETIGALAADMGGRIANNRELLSAYRDGFAGNTAA